ncbi:MAG: DinB family protein [Terriglobia bacterium]
MSTDFLNIAGIFKTNTGLFKKTIEGVPTEKLLARPGEDSNHMLWIAAHVVVHRAKVLKLLGQEWSAPWEGLLARGAKLTADERYPAMVEIVRAWDEVSGKLAPSLANASAEALGVPVPKGITLDGKISGQIAFLALHETYHVGQMAYLRKWLGCGQAIG